MNAVVELEEQGRTLILEGASIPAQKVSGVGEWVVAVDESGVNVRG